MCPPSGSSFRVFFNPKAATEIALKKTIVATSRNSGASHRAASYTRATRLIHVWMFGVKSLTSHVGEQIGPSGALFLQ